MQWLRRLPLIIFALLAVEFSSTIAVVGSSSPKRRERLLLRTKRQQCSCVIAPFSSQPIKCSCENPLTALGGGSDSQIDRVQRQQQQDLQAELQQLQPSPSAQCQCVLIVLQTALSNGDQPQYQCQCSPPLGGGGVSIPPQYNPPNGGPNTMPPGVGMNTVQQPGYSYSQSQPPPTFFTPTLSPPPTNPPPFTAGFSNPQMSPGNTPSNGNGNGGGKNRCQCILIQLTGLPIGQNQQYQCNCNDQGTPQQNQPLTLPPYQTPYPSYQTTQSPYYYTTSPSYYQTTTQQPPPPTPPPTPPPSLGFTASPSTARPCLCADLGGGLQPCVCTCDCGTLKISISNGACICPTIAGNIGGGGGGGPTIPPGNQAQGYQMYNVNQRSEQSPPIGNAGFYGSPYQSHQQSPFQFTPSPETTVNPYAQTQTFSSGPFRAFPGPDQYPETTTCIMYLTPAITTQPQPGCICAAEYYQCNDNVCCLQAKYRAMPSGVYTDRPIPVVVVDDAAAAAILATPPTSSRSSSGEDDDPSMLDLAMTVLKKIKKKVQSAVAPEPIKKDHV